MKKITKLHILNSFNNLMKQYPFEKITVEMILKESEVSKSTFYRYYIDKHDVMHYGYVSFIENLFKFNLCNCLKDVFIKLLENAVENKARLKHAYAYVGCNSFTSFLHDYSCNRFYSFVKDTREMPITEIEKMRISLFCYGNIWAIREYIDQKINLPIDVMADELCKSLPITIQNLWYE